MTADYDPTDYDAALDADFQIDSDAVDLPRPLPVPRPVPNIPFLLTASGLYTFTRTIRLPNPLPLPLPLPVPKPLPGGHEAADLVYDDDVSALTLYQREQLRLDIDGRYPQMTVSGTRSNLFTAVASWVASLTKTGTNTYSGPIWFKDGNVAAVPHTSIALKVTRSLLLGQRKVEATFSGGSAASFTRTYMWSSSYFHPVEFEFDTVPGAHAVTEIKTFDHPNRPATIASETLSLQTVYRRAGFDATISPGSGSVPLSKAGADQRWSDQEMHDAMQIYWSRFANKAQWNLWVLFAALHEQGTNLGGIMFDDIGPNHRQGTAIFTEAFIANAPAGDAAPDAWVRRMRFWTAAHEMGHAFNLAHSWQKALGTPWIALANDPEARSFMNYPYNVAGGQSAFFADFPFRFTDAELLFMRHAPERFVEMGNADWFDHHGFEQSILDTNDEFALTLSINATRDDSLPYLLPPVVEMALANRSGRARMVPAARLSERDDLTLIIKKDGRPARQWMPFSRHCGEGEDIILGTGEALYDSVLVGAGRNGWDMAEPGRYIVQAMLRVDGRAVFSNRLEVKVAPPTSRQEERIAQDLFTPEVGQVLAVNGTRGVEPAVAALNAVVALGDHPAARQAAVALAGPLATEFKLLTVDETAKPGEAPVEAARRVEVYGPDKAEAARLLAVATQGGADAAVNAVGHTRFIRVAPKLAAALDGGTDDARMALAPMRAGAATGGFDLSPEMQRTLAIKAQGLSA
ncbi:hypothetical protein [Sphingomonas profundi]|uniref:hypothetical protein n=1 Tax=Alterirhizorhabdus profundi TaxID=2681549 RepID=UPI0012E808D0|nr:hypothetical protein [Sphingomonas profundi]